MPGVQFGDPIASAPEPVRDVYDEARRCMSINAFTSTALLCRKILMNLAFVHGATEGKTFVFYIEYLLGKGFVPPTWRPWVEKIKDKGNDATHEIAPIDRKEAETVIRFTHMLLSTIYDLPDDARGMA